MSSIKDGEVTVPRTHQMHPFPSTAGELGDREGLARLCHPPSTLSLCRDASKPVAAKSALRLGAALSPRADEELLATTIFGEHIFKKPIVLEKFICIQIQR